MSTRVTAASGLMAAWLSVLSAAAQNPIGNGGFESVAADGSAPGWEFLGAVRVVSTQAAEGWRALRLERTPETRGETGLNRAWQPESGRQGSMLDRLSGALRFRYKAMSQERAGNLTVQIIPMTDRPLEFGGHRTRWHVPAHHVGDGQWHVGEFAYDYREHPEVRWVHVSARLVGPGLLFLDAFEWLPDIDATPCIATLSFGETTGHEGRQGSLKALLRNVGNRPLPPGHATIDLPAGLNCAEPNIGTPALEPGTDTELTWLVDGARTAAKYTLRIAVAAGEKSAGDRLVLDRDVMPLSLTTRSLMVAPGAPVELHLLARNSGHTLLNALPASLDAPDGVQVQRLPVKAQLAPGQEATVASWRVMLTEASAIRRFSASTPLATESVETHLLVANPGPAPPSPDRPAYAVSINGWHLVGSASTRLAVFSIDGPTHGALLQVRLGQYWQTLATVPRLAMIRTPDGDMPLHFNDIRTVGEATNPSLELRGRTTAYGQHWQARCQLTPALNGDGVSYNLELENGRDEATVLAVEGPMLHAGEELPERDDAMLPGLEWLVRGEDSSNALDIKPDHPDRRRYVPHPRKITIPAVGMRFGNLEVGLLWDAPPRQPSRESAGSLSLVFASPNRFEGQHTHLMGLQLPGVDRGLAENRRIADPPWRIGPGERIRIEAQMLAVAGANDALSAVDRWLESRGVPQPLPLPRESLLAEIAFSLQAYRKDKALWNPQWQKWYSDIIVGFRPTAAPAWELLVGAALLGPGTTASWARELAMEVLAIGPEQASESFECRTDIDRIRNLSDRARQLAASQLDDGNWAFTGEKAAETWPETGVEYGKLGPAGATEVGLSARKAHEVLEAALLSGNPALRKAGLNALEAMRRFDVPRAAQVWEVPVHTPDILASARAVDAFLTGYRLTGDPRYLSDAVFWARTGLPFVYMWHDDNLPAMQGATIPVFGATAYVLSWFAVAVQWNGLAYSGALYDLAEFDRSYPWQRIADNILRSAMYQQATAGDRLAQWPDAVNFIPGRPGPHGQTPPCFRPSTIIEQTLRSRGIRRHPHNVPLRAGDNQAVIRTCANVHSASWNDGDAAVDLTFSPPQYGSVAILNVSRPAEVSVNDSNVPETPAAGTSDPWWQWFPRECVLEVRLPKPGPWRLHINGMHPQFGRWIPEPLETVNFDFTEGLCDWHAAHDMMPLRHQEGVLETTTTGGDPYMIREGLLVQGKAGDRIEIDMALSPAADSTPAAAVYWGTADKPGFAASRTLSAPCPNDGRFHPIRIAVGEHKDWHGHIITQLRIDPLSGGQGTTVRIRGIRLVNGE